MRYDDWDVILFPRDSHVPIQEFKTACYNTQDAKGQQSSTLTCYISSLPPLTPFRISVHSWVPTAKPSVIIQSQRKPSQKVVYMVQVVVDGTRVFLGFFDIGSKWPQEIGHEKRTVTSPEHRTSQHKTRLGFPPFHPHTLQQSTWRARDGSGRINVVLSEQLMSRDSSPGELSLGISKELVCFSFQHASKDVLEQAGISWPIHNPLYLPTAHEGTHTSLESTVTSTRAAKARGTAQDDGHLPSPLSRASMSIFPRLRNREPLQRPNSHPPPFLHLPKPPPGTRGARRTGIWDDSFGSFRGSHDNVNLESWSAQRTASNPSTDVFAGDSAFTSSHPKPCPPWANPPVKHHHATSEWDDQRKRTQKDRQVVLTLRDDQFGQIMEAFSPPKSHDGFPMSLATQHNDYISQSSTVHACYPPKMGSVPVTSKPSAAALARKSSYPDLNATLCNKLNNASPEKSNIPNFCKIQPSMQCHPSTSSNKENCLPSQLRLATPFAYANRVSTPNPFPRLPEWGAGASMGERDGSTVFSSFNRCNSAEIPPPRRPYGNHGPAHTPSNFDSVKSRKEGLVHDSSNLPENEVQHDQSLLQPMVALKPTARNKQDVSRSTSRLPQKRILDIVEIIDIDAIDIDAIDPMLSNDEPPDATKLSPFKPNHKASMSSLDSTGRFERNMFNALGEDLYGPKSHADATVIGPELARALSATTVSSSLGGDTRLSPGAAEFEPVGKRKRQGTLSCEQDRTPLTKREKGGEVGGNDIEEMDMPCMRGD